MSDIPIRLLEQNRILAERLAALERMLGMSAQHEFPGQCRLAITVEDPDATPDTYPTSGAVVPIEFLDGEYTTAFDATADYYENHPDGKPETYAYNVRGSLTPVGTVIIVKKMRGSQDGITDGEWWFEYSGQELSNLYDLRYGVEGCVDAPTSFPVLDSSYSSVWLGSYKRIEQTADVEHDDAEGTPSSDGNWLINTTGKYKITLSGFIGLERVGSPETESTGTTSGHNHTINKVLVDQPSFYLYLYRKPVGNPNAIFSDGTGNIFFSTAPGIIQRNPSTPGNYNVPIADTWYVDLDAGDRISLYAAGYELTDWNITFGEEGVPRMEIQRIGDKVAWAAKP